MKGYLLILPEFSRLHESLAGYKGIACLCGSPANWLTTKRQAGSHRVLQRPGFPDCVFAFHDGEEIYPRMMARIARQTGLRPEHL